MEKYPQNKTVIGKHPHQEKLNKKYELELHPKSTLVGLKTLKESKSKEHIGKYVLCREFLISNLESGKVMQAYKEDTGELLVAKENNPKYVQNALRIESYLKEINFYNENVLLPINTSYREGRIIRFYEAGDMDLEKYLESHISLPIKTSLSILIRICEGANSLHKVGIFDLDLAPLNIIITKDSAKITDLDSSSVNILGNKSIKNTNYIKNRFTTAPEMFEKGAMVDKTVDIYTSATILFRLIVGDWPYNIERAMRESSSSQDKKQEEYRKLHKKGRIFFPGSIPEDLKVIIKKAMSPEPSNRYQNMNEFILAMKKAYDMQH